MLRGAASRVEPLALREGGPLFSGGSHLNWGVGKRYYTGIISYGYRIFQTRHVNLKGGSLFSAETT